jgi:phage recombination protein Bet
MTLEIDRRQQGLMFSQDKIQLLKDSVCKGASDVELEMFLHICKHTGLDPFMKQIYSIPRGGQRTTQTSIDGFRLIAERTGRYAPGKESTFSYDEKGMILSATSWVRKMTPDGTWHDVGATVYMSEFRGATTFWTKMPHVMLAKVAEAMALRKAFPADLNGIYTAEEMDQAEIASVPEVSNEMQKKEEILFVALPEDVKPIYIDYVREGKEKYKKIHKSSWAKEWDILLQMYKSDTKKLVSHVVSWNEERLPKKNGSNTMTETL